MTGYVLGRGADLDLDEIWEYIAKDKPNAADEWISRLFVVFDAIATSPGIGHTRKDFTMQPVLFYPVGSYFVIYRTTRKIVEIVAVVRGSRDLPSFLQRRLIQ